MKCECGEDLSRLVEKVKENAIDDACFDGQSGRSESEIECDECGRVYSVEANATVHVESSWELISCPEPEEMMIHAEPGDQFEIGDKIYVMGEDGKIAEIWSLPDENQISIFDQ